MTTDTQENNVELTELPRQICSLPDVNELPPVFEFEINYVAWMKMYPEELELARKQVEKFNQTMIAKGYRGLTWKDEINRTYRFKYALENSDGSRSATNSIPDLLG